MNAPAETHMSKHRLSESLAELRDAINSGEALHSAIFGAHVFTQAGDFAAMDAAEAWLQRHGFSVGRTQRGACRGILYGAFDIQKWRNLNKAERAALHGRLIGDRVGPVTIRFSNNLPPQAVEAIKRALVERMSREIAASHPMPEQEA